jgi:hypothetical protein
MNGKLQSLEVCSDGCNEHKKIDALMGDEKTDRWCGDKVKSTSSAVCFDTDWTDKNNDDYKVNICSNGLTIATNTRTNESKAEFEEPITNAAGDQC